MSYIKTLWRNNQSPAINAENLNKIENELEFLDQAKMNFQQNTSGSVEEFSVFVSKAGNDNNDGSQDHPVATLMKALEIASSKYMDARVEIISAGSYDVDMITNSGNIHITSRASGVVLNMLRNWINYSCHINIKGLDESPIVINGNDFNFYCDGCMVELNHVDLNCDFRMYGGNVNFTENCIIRNLTALSAYVYFGKNIAFKNTVVNRPALQLTNATVYFAYEWTVELANDDERQFIVSYGSTFTCTPVPSKIGGRYASNVMNLGTFVSSPSAYIGIKGLAKSNSFGTAIISNVTL